jgi:hypothetical protein
MPDSFELPLEHAAIEAARDPAATTAKPKRSALLNPALGDCAFTYSSLRMCNTLVGCAVQNETLRSGK